MESAFPESKMKRPLDKRIQWDDKLIKIQNLDWENSEADFDVLAAFVLERVQGKLLRPREKMEDYISLPVFRKAVRFAAGEYKDKHLSLGLFVFWRIKYHFFRKKKWDAPTSEQ
jgi:hypothetical protein